MTDANGRGEAEDARVARPEGPAPRPDAPPKESDEMASLRSERDALREENNRLFTDLNAQIVAIEALHSVAEAAIAAQDAMTLHHGRWATPHPQALKLFDALNAYRYPDRANVVMISGNAESAGTEAGSAADAIENSDAGGALTRARDALTTYGKHLPGCHIGCSVTRCDKCGGLLDLVRHDVGYLNREQFDAAKAGDWYCAACPGTRGAANHRYFWESELTKEPCDCGLDAAINARASEPQAKPTETSSGGAALSASSGAPTGASGEAPSDARATNEREA